MAKYMIQIHFDDENEQCGYVGTTDEEPGLPLNIGRRMLRMIDHEFHAQQIASRFGLATRPPENKAGLMIVPATALPDKGKMN